MAASAAHPHRSDRAGRDDDALPASQRIPEGGPGVFYAFREERRCDGDGSRGSVALKSGDTLDLTALCEGTDDMITLRARSGSMQAEKRVTFLRI